MRADHLNAISPQTHVLCVGAAVLDTIFKLKSLPTSQGKYLPTGMLQVAEGMASSAAYAVARMGGRVTLWSAVGDDAAGKQILAELSECGIDTSGVLVVDGARSALSSILVDEHGERIIIPFYDPALHKTPKSFTDNDIKNFDAVLVDVRWPELAYQVLKTARAVGIPAILDGDVAPVDILRRLGSVATHIIFSEPAATSLTDGAEGADMLTALRLEFPHIFLSVTFGEKGSFWMERESNSVNYQATLNIKAIDTLAAGDVFHGSFAQGLAEKLPTIEIFRLASAAAALKCTKFGGRLGTPSREVVEDTVREWIG